MWSRPGRVWVGILLLFLSSLPNVFVFGSKLVCRAGEGNVWLDAWSPPWYECRDCKVGQYNPVLYGKITCKNCADGVYQDQEGRTACKNCPPETYFSGYGAAACIDCPANTYQDQTGQSACKLTTRAPTLSPTSGPWQQGVPLGGTKSDSIVLPVDECEQDCLEVFDSNPRINVCYHDGFECHTYTGAQHIELSDVSNYQYFILTLFIYFSTK